MASHDWENELDDSDDEMDIEPPPMGMAIVDKTPLVSSRKGASAAAMNDAKTPLISHKSLEKDAPPPNNNYSSIVDFTPEIAHRKQAPSTTNHYDKTPLVSHKSSGSLKSFERSDKQRYANGKGGTPLKEEEDDLYYHADNDDDQSVSSIRSYLSTASLVSTASSVVTLSTQYLGNFKSSLMIPFTDDTGSPQKVAAGLAALFFVGAIVGLIMPKEEALVGPYRTMSSVLGWVYFVCWSVCFYPQVLLNYRRKATTGLSHDFAVLNFLGWLCYSSYDSAFYFSDHIKQLYAERFDSDEGSTVQINDVVFAIHAMLLSATYLVQIVWYGGKKCMAIRLKKQTWVLVFIIVAPSVVGPVLLFSGMIEDRHWLDYFYMLSYLKITCTLTKYTKQVVFNMKRKSTRGWNIWYNFLECTGGTLSMLQVVFDSANMGDWTGVTGNLAKFALGFATIFFDMLFFTQHYVIYPHNSGEVEKKKKPKRKTTTKRKEQPNGMVTQNGNGVAVPNGDYAANTEHKGQQQQLEPGNISPYGSTDESTR